MDILGDNEESHSSLATDPEVDLGCYETMDFSDSDHLEPQRPRGTEVLSRELVAREHFIKQGLGLEHIPECLFRKDPTPAEVITIGDDPPQPYVARHGAEIIVASENTWWEDVRVSILRE